MQAAARPVASLAAAQSATGTVIRRCRSSAARARLLEKNKKPPSFFIALAKSRNRTPVPTFSRNGFPIRTANHPEMIERYAQFVQRTAGEKGTAAAVAAFDSAAAAFPNPPPLVAATVLERSNLIMADPPQWEVDFLAWKEKRYEDKAVDYPDEFWENYGVIDEDLKPSYQAMQAKRDAKGGSSGRAGDATAASGAGDFDMFEDPDAEDEEAALTANTDTMKPSPRQTEADKISDFKSLDRALASRLVLLVREAESERWVLPGGSRMQGERMVDAAARHVYSAVGNDVNVWYPSNAPMGHWLQVFTPEQQAATQCYGAKVFFYRGEIINGRPALLEAGVGPTADSSHDGLDGGLDKLLNAHNYDDFRWLTRGEVAQQSLLAEDMAPFLHDVFGASPCEASALQVTGQGAVLPGFNDAASQLEE